MSWFTQGLTQTATRWTPSATRNAWGKVASWTRSLITCRWEECRERFIDREGRDSFSQAQVFVAKDLNEGDFLYLGSSSASDPTSVSSAYMVRKIDSTPSVTNRSSDVRERIAYL